VVARLLAYARPYSGATLVYVALLLTDSAVVLLPPWLTKVLIDDVLSRGRAPGGLAAGMGADRALGFTIAAIALTYLVMHANKIAIGWNSAFLSMVVARDVREDVFAKLQDLPFGYFAGHGTGDLVDRVTQDSASLEGFLLQGIQLTLVNVVRVVAVPAMLFALDWRLALVALVPVPFTLLTSAYLWRRVEAVYASLWVRRAELGTIALGAITGIRVVKAYVQEEAEKRRFADASRRHFDRNVEANRLTSVKYAVTGIFTSVGVLLVWWIGGWGTLHGSGASVGGLVAFVAYLALFYQPLEMLSRVGEWWNQNATVARRLFDLLDAPPEPRLAGTLPEPARGEVRFERVTFGYHPGRPVLRELSFEARPGERIGIVGRSGAGKTTLAHLVLRFFVPDSGVVTMDGADTSAVDPRQLREKIGLVPQDTYLFEGTIGENIAYGKPAAPPAAIVEAAAAAQAHEFIMARPLGYDSPVGENGCLLSGGERQRIALARALLYDPRILVLDEPTASLDADTEHALQATLEAVMRGRTTFVIAHRLSTLRHMHRILVVKDGAICEAGTHAELIAAGGEYARLSSLQSALDRVAST
jgi:ATP-binding cassette subfamily B protein